MNNSINTKECGISFKRGFGLAGLVTALYLNLSYPGEVKADTNTNHGANITEVINQSDYVDSSKLIDFDTAKIINEPIIEAKIDSHIDEYKMEYFQFLDNLSDQEKFDYVYKILKEDKKVKKVVADMLKDENIIKAIKLGDKKTIEENFLNTMGHKFEGYAEGIFNYLLALLLLKIGGKSFG